MPELQGRRLLGVHGFSQTDVQDIEDDASVWLLEFEGDWWAELVTQIAPAWISPTFQLAWNIYGPTIDKPAIADSRIEHLPDALSALIGTRFLTVDSCVSTGIMVLEDRLSFEVDGEDTTKDMLVLRLGYLKAAEDYLRTGNQDDLGNQGLDAEVVTPSKVAEMDAWELKRRLQRPIHNLGRLVLEQWLAPTHFPACTAPWDDRAQVQRLRVLRQALTEFLKWFRPSYKLSDNAVADPKRPELKWSWPVQLAVLEDAWERIAAWELLVNAGLAVNPDTGELFAAANEVLKRSDDLRWELPELGLGTLFTPAWWGNTAASELDRQVLTALEVTHLLSDTAPMWIAGTGTVPNGLVGQEIPQDFLWAKDMLKRYAPVRQAYRHWFLQFRDCHTHGLRITHQWKISKPIPWILTLDAAMERGTVGLSQLSQVPRALALFVDDLTPIPSDIPGDVPVKVSGGRADVWIETDEEAPDCLRITSTPQPTMGQIIQMIRVPRDALEQWWMQQRPPEEPLWQPLARRLEQLLGREVIVDGELKVWHDGGPVVTMTTTGRHKPLPLRLPPFTEEDLNTVEREWQYLPKDMPCWVVALDQAYERWLFPIGWDAVSGELRVRFPSVWPATPSGRGAIHTQYDLADHIALRALGDAARPEGWQLRVQAWRPDSALPADTAQVVGLWGLIDIGGRLVLPLDYTYVGPVQPLLGTLSQTTCAPLPEGRTQPWQWAEVLTTGQPPVDAHGRKVCDVMEVWSGQRVNPPGIKAVQGSLTWGYFTACHDSTASSTSQVGAKIGLMLCTQTQPGPLRWSWVYASNAVCSPMSPARCAVSGLYGYVGALGQTIMEPCFESAGGLDSELAQIRLTLADAQAQGTVLTLPDGQQCGPEGVLVVSRITRADESPTWRWLLAPRWRNVGGEYDGHFSVQDVSGAWAMVTPDGQAVTPFAACEPEDHLGNDEHQQIIQRFKHFQHRRFMAWLLQAVQTGSLAGMQGRLHSSYGHHDYGASPSMNLTVQTIRYVVALVMKYGPTRDEEVTFAQGNQFTWNPALRNYAGFVDLRTHAVVGEVADREQNIRIPWDALALVVNPNPEGTTADEATAAEEKRCMQALSTTEHLSAMRQLIQALDSFIDWLDSHPINPPRATQPPCPTRDARHSCDRVAKQLHRLEVFLTLQDRQMVHSNAQWLQRELQSADLPNLFTRPRPKTEDDEHSSSLVTVMPWWSGVEVNAVTAPDHPLAQDLLSHWTAVLFAFNEWEPYFSEATSIVNRPVVH
ncbi:MAG: hypothetical protein IPH35_18600 [Rhodoferax sp.]|nr:hypothetical protein [Rhodoferax sp.]